QRGVLEARQQRCRQDIGPAATQRLDGDACGLRLAAFAGLDLDVAAQTELTETGDRLLQGRHRLGQCGARREGDQAVDAQGALERGIVHQDGYRVGGQLDVDLDPA